MNIATSQGQAALALAEAIGLNPKTNMIKSFTVDVSAGEGVLVTAVMFVDESKVQDLAETFAKYKLTFG